MLSNKDFLGLMEGGKKEKFDLKQVKQWDQQNENAYKKTTSHAQKKKEEKMKQRELDKAEEPAYRDRAQERRLDANPDYDPQFDIAETLDVEQSKFLGGDVQHTHLVKGLDYTLLRKMRQEQEQEQKKGQMGAGMPGMSGMPGLLREVARPTADVRTVTTLGANIKQVLRSVGQQKSQGGGGQGSVRGAGLSMSAAVLQRTAFDYNVDILRDDELPTTVLRSQELSSDLRSLYGFVPRAGERVYVPPPSLLQALTAALDMSSLDKKAKRRKDAAASSSASSSSSDTARGAVPQGVEDGKMETVSKVPPATVAAPAAMSIFDDLAPDTSYTPSSSSSSSSQVREGMGTGSVTGVESVGKTDKTYFGVGMSGKGEDQGEGNGSGGGNGRSEEEERMAPVLELLRAQQVREQRLQKGLQASGPSQGKMMVAHGVAHRDILGGAVLGGDGAGRKGGDSMSAQSSYDVYPESGDYETYDSDTEDTGGGAKAGTGKGKRAEKEQRGDRKRPKLG